MVHNKRSADPLMADVMWSPLIAERELDPLPPVALRYAEAVEWGDRELERQRHNQFVDQHSHLEWFRLDGPLVEHIAGLRDQWQATEGVTVEQWLADLGVRGCS